jgi:hypothetical protein
MKRNPMRTKTDKVRLGPLGYTQLEKLFETTSKPKDTAKIQRHLKNLDKKLLRTIKKPIKKSLN